MQEKMSATRRSVSARANEAGAALPPTQLLTPSSANGRSRTQGYLEILERLPGSGSSGTLKVWHRRWCEAGRGAASHEFRWYADADEGGAADDIAGHSLEVTAIDLLHVSVVPPTPERLGNGNEKHDGASASNGRQFHLVERDNQVV